MAVLICPLSVQTGVSSQTRWRLDLDHGHQPEILGIARIQERSSIFRDTRVAVMLPSIF